MATHERELIVPGEFMSERESNFIHEIISDYLESQCAVDSKLADIRSWAFDIKVSLKESK